MDKSVELRCDFSYQHIEYTKSKTYQIMSFSFPDHEEIFIEFIKKIPHVFIETAGIDDIKFVQLFASKRYLSLMNNDKAREYIADKKRGVLKNINSHIYSALIKKVKKVF